MPRIRTIRLAAHQRLRYGENPHTKNAEHLVILPEKKDPLAAHRFEQILGRAPSYGNVAGLDEVVRTMTRIAACYAVNFGRSERRRITVIQKHGITCGAAVRTVPPRATPRKRAEVVLESARMAIAGDPESAHGGVVGANYVIDGVVASALRSHLNDSNMPLRPFDVVVAAGFTKEAVRILNRAKEARCILLVNPALLRMGKGSMERGVRYRFVRGGLLTENVETPIPVIEEDGGAVYRIWGNKDPKKQGTDYVKLHQANLALAWAVGAAPANAIAITGDEMLLALAAGDQNRKRAALRAKQMIFSVTEFLAPKAAYSNGFFGFLDAPRILAHGIDVIMVPSGSMRDQEIGMELADRTVLMQIPREWRSFAKE